MVRGVRNCPEGSYDRRLPIVTREQPGHAEAWQLIFHVRAAAMVQAAKVQKCYCTGPFSLRKSKLD